MQKSLVYLLCLTFIAGTIAGFPVSLEVNDRKATFDDPAEFQVVAENDFVDNRSFRISSLQTTPRASSWFSYEYSETASPGEKARLNVTVTPPKNAIQNNYGFRVNVRTLDGDNLEKLDDYFILNSGNELKITDSGIEKTSYRPGETVKTHLTLINTASGDIDNYRVKASFMGENYTKKGDLLSPGSERTYRFNIEVPETSPGNQTLTMHLVRDGNRRKTTESLQIEEVRNIDRTVSEEDRILSLTRTLEVENNGNDKVETEINETLPDYVEPLTVFSDEPSEVENLEGKKRYTWKFDLEPGESAEVKYRSRYWPPLVVLAAIFGGVMLLKKLHTGLSFHKRARKTGEGVRIHIEVHNTSRSSIERLEVKDFVPDVASVGEEFPMAKPVIRKTSDGTRLNWEIEKMEPGEQRVFEYSIKPLVEVEGGIVLPEAELEVKDRRVSQTGKVEVEFSPE